MEGYFNAIASRVPQPHIIGDGNELSEIAFSHHFLSKYRGSNPLACGLSVRWMSGNDKTYDLIDGPHSGEAYLRQMFSSAGFITLHNIQPTTLDRSFRRIEPVLRRYPRLKVIFSTDGAGAGSSLRRPQGSRPNVKDIREITERARVLAGENFGGVEIKVLNFFDFRSLLEQLSGTIRPRN